MTRVIDSLGLRTTPDELAKKVTATVPLNTATIDVAVVDGDAAEAARIANALGEQLVTTVKQLSPPSSSGAQTVAATIIRPAVTPLNPTTPRTAQNSRSASQSASYWEPGRPCCGTC